MLYASYMYMYIVICVLTGRLSLVLAVDKVSACRTMVSTSMYMYDAYMYASYMYITIKIILYLRAGYHHHSRPVKQLLVLLNICTCTHSIVNRCANTVFGCGLSLCIIKCMYMYKIMYLL